jgi:hypothetical protein
MAWNRMQKAKPITQEQLRRKISSWEKLQSETVEEGFSIAAWCIWQSTLAAMGVTRSSLQLPESISHPHKHTGKPTPLLILPTKALKDVVFRFIIEYSRV